MDWIVKSVQFSWVEFSSVFRCALNWRRAATTDDGRRIRYDTIVCILRAAKSWRVASLVYHNAYTFLTVKSRRRPSVAVRRRFSSNDRYCIEWPIHEIVPRLWRTCDDRQFRCGIVAGSMHSGKLNWTEQLSWVQFSFPLTTRRP